MVHTVNQSIEFETGFGMAVVFGVTGIWGGILFWRASGLGELQKLRRTLSERIAQGPVAQSEQRAYLIACVRTSCLAVALALGGWVVWSVYSYLEHLREVLSSANRIDAGLTHRLLAVAASQRSSTHQLVFLSLLFVAIEALCDALWPASMSDDTLASDVKRHPYAATTDSEIAIWHERATRLGIRYDAIESLDNWAEWAKLVSAHFDDWVTSGKCDS